MIVEEWIGQIMEPKWPKILWIEPRTREQMENEPREGVVLGKKK